MWLKESGFVERVGQWWSGYQRNGSPSTAFIRKLHTLKANFKKWMAVWERGNMQYSESG